MNQRRVTLRLCLTFVVVYSSAQFVRIYVMGSIEIICEFVPLEFSLA